jgi:hypothetical protein
MKGGESNKQLAEVMRSVDLRSFVEGQRRFGDIMRSIDFRGIAESERRFKAHFPHHLRTLALYGWYISVWHTPLADIPPLVSLLKSGKTKEADRRLCRHFNDLSGEIESDLSKRFPARAIILKKAFDAHRRRDFELSIPVFLAQADGIMIETLGKPEKKYSVYSRHKMPTLRELVEKIATVRIERDILEVALLEMPLNDSEAHKFASGAILNRNAVQHGINTTYANEPNSCRAISWLQYVAHFDEAKKMANRRKKSSQPGRDSSTS